MKKILELIRIAALSVLFFFLFIMFLVAFEMPTIGGSIFTLFIAFLILIPFYFLLPKKYRVLNRRTKDMPPRKLSNDSTINTNEIDLNILDQIDKHELTKSNISSNEIESLALLKDNYIGEKKIEVDITKNIPVDNISTLRIDKEVLDLLPETSRNTLENYINKTSNKNNKTVTIHTIVVGTKYENRDKKLKELINDLKENDYFYELYEGYSNQEIIDGGDYYMEYSKEEPIYELTEESLPYAEVVPEPDNEYDPNAVAVYVGESQSTKFQLGYLPKEDAKRIQDLFKNGEVVYVDAQIKGGKYKFVEMDDYGEEKVRQRTKKYLIDLEITFVKYL